MKTVIIDGYSANPGDLSWEVYAKFGEYIVYDRTETTPNDELIMERIKDADAIVVNNNEITREMMIRCPKLKFICEAATGYNNIDVKAAEELGITVTNVPAYSTDAVAQHTIALLLELTNHVAIHNQAIQTGEWFDAPDFRFTEKPLSLLAGKSIGIIGYGTIGKKVADICIALGMTLNIYSADPKSTIESDVISLHCPLNDNTSDFVNKKLINMMKDGVIILNSARGGLINEDDMSAAIKSGKVAAYAADVLSTEPPEKNNPLIGLENCILTPHIAWIPRETRQLLMDVCIANQESFLAGGTLNRVSPL
ncbi:MAG: D-2-hydroxyacid dehydrogenase [Peptostreptococcaceae bacterium]|nr:D-2-hydroxyacid dehydrogenase [Peptostreptococcaceae bacterium]